MASPADRVYSESHEWHQVSGDVLTLGLTRYAVDTLTDITYVQMKPAGFKFNAGQAIGEVESVKTTSDIYCACGGEVLDEHAARAHHQSRRYSEPICEGWLCKIKVSDASGLKSCKPAAEYDKAHPAG
ncbi:MAG: glycine cleavage system protein H [Phycisphaerae bacterium]|nr:glycine cleavage system protein H [Phycisphaerae bacterium]